MKSHHRPSRPRSRARRRGAPLVGAALAALVLAIEPGMAQPNDSLPPAPEGVEPAGPPPEPPPSRNIAPARPWAPRGPRWSQFWFARDSDSTSPAGWRAQFWEELAHVPTFQKHLREFIEIQKQRMTLEQKRREIALATDKPTDTLLTEFHELLRREEVLSSRSADLLRRIRGDRAAIEREIQERLEQLDKAAESRSRDTLPSRPYEPAPWPRARHFYTFVLDHLGRLDSVPTASEWFSALGRAAWDAERTNRATIEAAVRQLERLQHEQEDLRRRLDKVQDAIDDLAELLAALQSREPRREKAPPKLPRGDTRPRESRGRNPEP